MNIHSPKSRKISFENLLFSFLCEIVYDHPVQMIARVFNVNRKGQ